MNRRAFIALAAGATAWPPGANAQPPPTPVIGFLHSASPEPYAIRLQGFHRGLKESGYVPGENVAILYHWAENQLDRLPDLAADLVRRRVAVIVASPGNAPVVIAKTATTTIPIVFLVSEDPVKHGLVASLARPGGNMTGVNFFNAELNAKRLELLRELLPQAMRIALLLNPANATNAQTTLTDVETAARTMGLQIQVLKASSNRDIDTAFNTLARDRPDALFVSGDSLFNSRRLHLAILAARHALPALYSSRDYPESGGLISYGSNVTDAYRELGVYTGRVLKGAKPAELPIVQPSKFELIINHQTARAIGIDVPPSLLARADEVIE
jgi:putative ABC transport system substrate-binding protein